MLYSDIKKFYDDIGLETIPVPYGQKFPPPQEWQKKSSEELWEEVDSRSNIAIKLGTVADLESDDLASEANLGKLFSDFGITSSPRCRSRRGLHRFVRVVNAPDNLNLTNWADTIGKGEARVKNCYSLVPDSEVNHFKYFWEDNSWKYFTNLPVVEWADISKYTKYSHKSQPISILPRYLHYDPDTWIAKTLDYLTTAIKGKEFSIDGHYWPSRSEAEAAIVLRLDTCGSLFSDIEYLFETMKPAHYWELGSHRQKYLSNSYEQAQSLGIRPKLAKAYNFIEGNSQADQILKVLISIAHQLNKEEVFASYEQLATFIGISPNSKAGPKKATLKLEKEGKIIIKKGRSRVQGIGGYPTTYSLAPVIADLEWYT